MNVFFKNPHSVCEKVIIECMLLECSTGYTGINCTEQCPFPTYGEICQKLCNCDSTLCDFSTGCKPNRKYIYYEVEMKKKKHLNYYIMILNFNI